MERIAEGVHRLGSALVNWYLVEDGDRLTVVDAGLPRYRGQLDDALRRLGRSLSDVEAIVLTHAHPDHVGFAEALRTEIGVPVLVHEADAEMARTAKGPLGERGHLAGRGVLITGDVLCSRNPMTGRDGPQIMPGSFTVDIAQALDSLGRIGGLDAGVLGFGHGAPWTNGTASAVARARELGPS